MSAATRPPAKRRYQEARILFAQGIRDLQLAALLAGILGGLLIIQLTVDELLEVLPGIIAYQASAVEEDSRRGVDLERSTLCERGIYICFGSFSLHAPAKLHAIEVLGGLRELHHLGFQIVGC